MPKAKFKRKGATLPLFDPPTTKKSRLSDSSERIELDKVDYSAADPEPGYPCLNKWVSDKSTNCTSKQITTCTGDLSHNKENGRRMNLIDLPEEIILLILVRLDLASVAAIEATCRRLRKVIADARVWRRILLNKLEFEPGLRRFLPASADPDKLQEDNALDPSCYKQLLENLKVKVDYAWMSNHGATITRSAEVYGQVVPGHILSQIQTSGRYFIAFYGTLNQSTKDNYVVDMIDVFDRGTAERVRRIDQMHGKPDVFRIVEELGIFLISYTNLLLIHVVGLEEDRDELVDLGGAGDADSGSVCDVVVRDYISIRGTMHRRVVMVAMNTEPLEHKHFHIGQLKFFGLSDQGLLGPVPIATVKFNPVPLKEGRFFNQCIQKKGLSDFNEGFAVVVVGGCEGSAVLGVVDVQARHLLHRLQLKAPRVSAERDEGCEAGLCQYTVISLMIDRIHTNKCSVLLSTGQLIVVDLATGNTIFHRHLQFDGQLKLAIHQPGLLGRQRLAIKFRNYVTFYDLILAAKPNGIRLRHVRTLRIRNVDSEGKETRLDDNPSQELRKQFGELQKRFRALSQYTTGLQKKLDKGLRPGTVTQGVMSMTKKVHLVTSKLDQAHGKAREIEAVVIACIAFDNRFCHALTLNRDLVSFDLAGALGNYDANKLERGKYPTSTAAVKSGTKTRPVKPASLDKKAGGRSTRSARGGTSSSQDQPGPSGSKLRKNPR